MRGSPLERKAEELVQTMLHARVPKDQVDQALSLINAEKARYSNGRLGSDRAEGFASEMISNLKLVMNNRDLSFNGGGKNAVQLGMIEYLEAPTNAESYLNKVQIDIYVPIDSETPHEYLIVSPSADEGLTLYRKVTAVNDHEEALQIIDHIPTSTMTPK